MVKSDHSLRVGEGLAFGALKADGIGMWHARYRTVAGREENWTGPDPTNPGRIYIFLQLIDTEFCSEKQKSITLSKGWYFLRNFFVFEIFLIL